jgi:hypothetical protein
LLLVLEVRAVLHPVDLHLTAALASTLLDIRQLLLVVVVAALNRLVLRVVLVVVVVAGQASHMVAVPELPDKEMLGVPAELVMVLVVAVVVLAPQVKLHQQHLLAVLVV